MSERQKSQELFAAAGRVMPGGVNSPVRAFRAVGGTPFFAASGEGAYLTDVDGNRYVDYLQSWGPLILGHAHPAIVDAVIEVTRRGTSFGVPTEIETLMAEQVIRMVPSIEVIRMVNSGTEATMSALRLARAFTNRKKIVKFAGGYHGHADNLLVTAGSGVATFGLPNSPGVPASTTENTLVAPYNNLEAVRELFHKFGEDIACVIVEPVAGNMGCIIPVPGFLEGLRAVTREYGALLILDEVMTGFRVAKGGAQERFQIEPDLTTLGKVIGGGLPVGAYGGRREIMDLVAPAGAVYQAGTLSGNPLAMAAGLTALQLLEAADAKGLYQRLERYGASLVDVFVQAGKEKGLPVSGVSIGGMFGLFFHEGPVTDLESALLADTKRYGRFFHGLLHEGVFLAPSQLESGFVSAVHGENELQLTSEAISRVMRTL